MGVIEQFLGRAESLALAGDRSGATELLVVALDNSRGDPEILRRCMALHSRILGYAEAETRTEERNWHTPSSGPIQPRTFATSAPTKEDLDWLLGDARPVVADIPGAQPDRLRERKASPLVVALSWCMLFIAVVATSLTIFRPDALGHLIRYRQFRDPLAQAWEWRDRGDYDKAVAEATRLLDANDRIPEALLFIAEIELERGNHEAARTHLRYAVADPGATWAIALSAARYLAALGDPAAGEAYARAFERGAPGEYWLEIAQAFWDMGRRESAVSLYRAIVRSQPPELADSALATLRRLGFE